ncbi:MAG: 50S ribosomal protein L1 [Anaerolineae bacterium]
MAKHGKKYLEAAGKVDRNKFYAREEAISLIKATAYTKFDPTVEVHFNLGVDPRKAEQMVRDVVVLPHGLGKTVKILVFADGEDAVTAKEAGADYIADADTVKKIQGGWVDFDIAIAVPQQMGMVGRLGRILGPRGLMPSPKAGTVVPGQDLPRVIEESRAGRVEFRVDKTSNLHSPIGKASFSAEQLLENMDALFEAIRRNRPDGLKGPFVNRLTIANTMGPGIKVDHSEAGF